MKVVNTVDLNNLRKELIKKLNKFEISSLKKNQVEKIVRDILSTILDKGITPQQYESLKEDLENYISNTFNITFTEEDKSKLDGIASGAEVNVQADWSETNPNSDAYIKNKPTNLSAFTNGPGYLTSHQSLSDVFADVAYDNNSKQINFYGKGDTSHTNVIGSISAADFIKDGMVSNVEIKNVDLSGTPTTCLVITFNTESNKEDINIPISKIFNATNYYTKAEIDGKGYLTSETDPNVPQWAKEKDKPEYSASEISGLSNVATSGSYNDLSDKPTFSASDVGALPDGATIKINNQTIKFKDGSFDLGEIETIGGEVGTLNTNNTEAQTASSSESFSGNISLHKISKTGSYDDLLNKPTIPAAQVQTDWDAVDGMGKILNKPDLSGYLTSESETQLSKGTPSGEGNVVTDISVNGHKITLTKGKVQSEITAKSKLSADLIQDGNDNKVFTSTDKSKLDGITAGAEPNVQADWNASSGKSQILNKPDLATVATSGSYNDLSNKPTITVNDQIIPVTDGTYDLGTISAIQGNGRNIDIVDNDSDATDSNTLYFFDNSLLQGVGLYNSLLQNGSIVGNDGKTYTYHPGKLYHLYSDGSFIELEYEEISNNPWKGKNYIAFGDSITHTSWTIELELRYCALVAERLGLNLTNAGVSGSTMIDTDRYSYPIKDGKVETVPRSFIHELLGETGTISDVSEGVEIRGPYGVDLSQYDLITIFLGHNDRSFIAAYGDYSVGTLSNKSWDNNWTPEGLALNTFYGAYEAAVGTIKQRINNTCKLVLCTPVNVYNGSGAETPPLERYAQAVRDIANKYDCIVADFYSNSGVNEDIDPDSVGADGLHPTVEAHEKMAKVLQDKLLEIGQTKNISSDHKISYKDNIVYYNDKQTSMKRYGDLVIPHRIKYADTSDTAYFFLQVKGPFFAEKTEVTLTFNEEEIEVYETCLTGLENRYIKNGKKSSSSLSKGFRLEIPVVEKTKLSSGDHIDFTYSNFYKTRNLLVKRIKGDPTQTPLTSKVTFNNGYEDCEVRFKFSVVDLVFKDGVLNPSLANFSGNSSLFGKTMVEITDSENNNATFYSDTDGYLIKSNYLYKQAVKHDSTTFISLSNVDERENNFIFIKTFNGKKYRAALNYDYDMEIPGSYYVKYENIRYNEFLKPMGIRFRLDNSGNRVYWTDTIKDAYPSFPPGRFYDVDVQFPTPDALSRMFGESIISSYFHDLHHEPVRKYTTKTGVYVDNEDFGSGNIAHLELAVDTPYNGSVELPCGYLITEIGVLRYSDPFDDEH